MIIEGQLHIIEGINDTDNTPAVIEVVQTSNTVVEVTQRGTQGKDGKDGASAYQIAVANGFTGTEAQWLESLRGPGTGSSFLPAPDLIDESDPNYFYFGWENANSGWLIQRQTRRNGASASATTGHADLSSAWAARITLEYS